MLRKILLMVGTVIGVTVMEFFLTCSAVTYFRDNGLVASLLGFLELVHLYSCEITSWWPMTFTLGLPGLIASLALGFNLGETFRERRLLVAVGLGFWVIAYVASVLFLFVWYAITSPGDRPVIR